MWVNSTSGYFGRGQLGRVNLFQLLGKPSGIPSPVSQSKTTCSTGTKVCDVMCRDVGLSTTYNRRYGVYLYILQLMALPFLPARHIQPTFAHLKTKANTAELQSLVAYIDKQLFSNQTFEVSSLSAFRQTVRTNNDVEGWHHRLDSKAGMSGLVFYRIVPLLKREASLVELALRSGDLSRNRRGYRELDIKLEDLWNKYETYDMMITSFVKACWKLYGIKTAASVATE